MQFSIDAMMPKPYDITWQVINHGKEARDVDQLRHETLGDSTHWEETKYRGHHFMDCLITKDGQVVAKARHVVNIA